MPLLESPPSFSVIIAAYAAAPYIGVSIRSALEQTRPPHEIIVCDDGSTDDLRSAVAPFLDKITLLRQENRGVAAARNTALEHASGDFISVLDPDDLYCPRYFEAVSALATVRSDLDVLTTDAYLESGGRIWGRYYGDKARFISDDQRRGIIHNNFVFGLACVRREQLMRNGGWDENIRVGSDSDLWTRMILSGSSVGLVDKPLAVYRLRPHSLSSNTALNMMGEVARVQRCISRAALTQAELGYARSELRIKRREAAIRAAEASLLGAIPSPRRHCLRVAIGPRGLGGRRRAKAVLAAAFPGLAARAVSARLMPHARQQDAFERHGR